MTPENYLSTAQMREADRRAIEDLGIPGVVLMYNAGRAVFAQIPRGPVGIVCGKGNNGGDGYVVGLLALTQGMEVRLVTLADAAEIRGDARVFYDAFKKVGGMPKHAITDDDVAKAMAEFADCNTMIDAMLGTGFKGEVRGPVRAAIALWPAVHTIAVDVPSGLDADTGNAHGPCITANLTVTFQAPKLGFQNPATGAFLGAQIIADIGIPPQCLV